MKFLSKIPYLFVAGLAWIVIISSCANQGMPTGGPKDTIPPVLVGTQPKMRATNYSGDEVRLTFNEYILPSEVSEELVVSPPLKKRPGIRTKSKTLIIQFNEPLKDSTTYSLDFKNSVVDNNEKNPLKNLRFSFSTGDVYDSLRVAGRVMNAFNLEPLEKALVMLHRNLHDSAVYKVIPDYIAKTDENGIFMIDNIAPGNYHIFGITDANADMMYNEGAEQIAFEDTLVVPSAEYHEVRDTLVKGVDSLLVTGHTEFHPDPFYLRAFTEDIFDQYLDSYKRDARNRGVFVFNESVADTFGVRLLNYDATNWYIMEPNKMQDSLVMWIADTLVARMDTLVMELSYLQLDTTNQLYVKKDTVDMNFVDKTDDSSRRRRKAKEDEKGPKPVEQFILQTNIGMSLMELNNDLEITSPEPVKRIDSTMILLYASDDTLKAPLNFRFEKDSSQYRTYKMEYDWEPEAKYTLQIDSAAWENIYGITSKELIKSFKIREEDYYGSIKLNITNVKSPVIVQLLKNSDDEDVISQKIITEDGSVTFDFLPPAKYRLKLIYDRNGNGKWDTGSYQDKYQAERVSYINEVLKVRSNWDSVLPLDLKPEATFYKNIIDKELLEQQRKAAEEKAKKEREQENKPQQQQDGGSNMFRNSGGGGRNFRMQ
ncbi:MAG TPA: Ig-like domain-containing protein [Draconibacterium sp.]|nr:Ig-like domain-containing protein [Draconibacterium sp.]